MLDVPELRRLLSYLVDASLSGNTDALQVERAAAYLFEVETVDLELSQKLRHEIRRLRTRLRDYDETHHGEVYSLHIPRGGCEPVLRRRTASKDTVPKRTTRSLKPILALLGGAVLLAIVVLASTFFLTQFVQEREGFETLTAIAGEINHFTINASAQQIAFSGSSKRGGISNIFILNAVGGQPKRLTDSAAMEIYPSFSANGKSIAFFRALEDRSFQLIVRDLGTGLERVVASSPLPTRAAWSNAGVALYVPLPSETSPTLAIHRVDLASLQQKRLTDPDVKSFGDRSPAVSPDGKWLAWFRDAKPDGEIWMSGLDGSDPRRMVRRVTNFRGLDWTPDSRHLIGAFAQEWRQSVYRIDRMTADATPLNIGHPDIWYPAFAPKDGKLVFLEAPSQARLFDIDPDRGQFKPVNLALPGLQAATLSPDRRAVALFAPQPDAAHYWLGSMDGRLPVAISPLTVKGMGAPVWEPNGKSLVVAALDADNYHLHTLLTTGGTMRRLFPGNATELDPAFSPDGQTLYFLSDRSGEWNVWKSSWPSTTEPVAVTQNGVRMFRPSLDGKSIALVHTRSSGLWNLNLATGKEELLLPSSDFPARTNLLAWTETQVVYLDPFLRGGCCSIEGVRTNPVDRTALFRLESVPFQPEAALSTSAPGSRFLLMVTEQSTASLRRVSVEIKD